MKTTVVNSTQGNGTATTGKAQETAGVAQKVNGLPVSKDFDKAKTDGEPKQAEQVKPDAPKADTEQVKQEPTKKEIKEELKAEKAPLNLESTIKLIETLHRRKIQRDKLIDTIDTLDAFEVAQLEDAEETDSNQYQGCLLTIEDDKKREFSTKNPVIIKMVAGYINKLCMDRLAEIEGEIHIPA